MKRIFTQPLMSRGKHTIVGDGHACASNYATNYALASLVRKATVDKKASAYANATADKTVDRSRLHNVTVGKSIGICFEMKN
jgi:hypothetical protein